MNARYAPSDDVLASHLEGEAVLLDLGDKRYYRLNETAAHAWRILEEDGPLSEVELAGRLTDRFDVDPGTARAAVMELLADFEARGLVRRADAKAKPAASAE